MPLFGAHMSIAGGYYKALQSAKALGCETVQLFVSNPRQFPVKQTGSDGGKKNQVKTITEEEAKTFAKELKKSKLRFPTAHNNYLVNLASPDDHLYQISIAGLVAELQKAEVLGLDYLVMHPGSHQDSGVVEGLKRVAIGLDEVHRVCPQFKVKILLETTAGQGSSLGHRFEHLAAIRECVKEPDRLGVCLDTCHVFAAGYPLAPEKEYRKTMREFDTVVGLKYLRCFHMNDSKKELGSRVDRHEHIGKGCLGLEPFRLLVNDYRFRARPMILETPKEEGKNKEMDGVNLATLKSLLEPKKK